MTIGESALELIKNYAKLYQKYGKFYGIIFRYAHINGIKLQINNFSRYNRFMSPMRMLPEACREHETKYLLILCSYYTRILAFWNFSNILLKIS